METLYMPMTRTMVEGLKGLQSEAQLTPHEIVKYCVKYEIGAPPSPALLKHWLSGKASKCRKDQFETIYAAYRAVICEEGAIRQGIIDSVSQYVITEKIKEPKAKSIAVTAEIREMIAHLYSQSRSIELLIKQYSAPHKMTRQTLSHIKHGRIKSIRPDHEKWLRNTYEMIKQSDS